MSRNKNPFVVANEPNNESEDRTQETSNSELANLYLESHQGNLLNSEFEVEPIHKNSRDSQATVPVFSSQQTGDLADARHYDSNNNYIGQESNTSIEQQNQAHQVQQQYHQYPPQSYHPQSPNQQEQQQSHQQPDQRQQNHSGSIPFQHDHQQQSTRNTPMHKMGGIQDRSLEHVNKDTLSNDYSQRLIRDPHFSGALNMNDYYVSSLKNEQYNENHLKGVLNQMRRPPLAVRSAFKTNKDQAAHHIESMRRTNPGNLLGTTDNRYGDVDSTRTMLRITHTRGQKFGQETGNANNEKVAQINIVETNQIAQSTNNNHDSLNSNSNKLETENCDAQEKSSSGDKNETREKGKDDE